MSTGISPVFIHSLFRSGSTYLFTVFRRARDENGAPLFTAFQEAMHEVAVYCKDDASRLLEIGATGEDQIHLRHPDTAGPYFKELFDTHAAWADVIADRSVYDVFGAEMQTETADYFRALMSAAPHRPVFQECRTSLRIRSIREAVGGTHIHLWRNPWDQWWSMRVTRYFDTAIQMFLNAPGRPTSVDLLRNRTQFPNAPGVTLDGDYVFFQRRPPVPTVSYKSFYLIWLLSLEHGLKNTQVDINIESLSASSEYRQHTVETLRELGIGGISLDDSAAPMSHFGETDRAFFEPLEEEVHQILRLSGWSHEQLSSLLAVRKAHEPAQRQVQRSAEGLKKTLAQVRTTYLETERDRATDAQRAALEMSDLTIRVQGREADAARFAESLQAALAAQAAEAGDNRIRLDAALHAAQTEINETHVRLREALAQRDAANVEIRETHLRLQDALRERDGFNTEVRDAHLRLQSALQERDAAKVEIRDAQLRFEAALQAERVALRDKIDRMRRNSEHSRAALMAEMAALRQAQDDEANLRHLQLNQLADEFRQSLSWRMTAPVRAASALARAAVSRARGSIRQAMHFALGMVRRYPWMKQPVLAAASINPAIKQRLVGFGQRHAPVGAAPAIAPDLLVLTPDPSIVSAWTAELRRAAGAETVGRAS